MRDVLSITRAISDRNRVRILRLLSTGELCVCQICAVLDLAPSTISKHLSILDAARLVDSRKTGRWVYYRLPDAPAPEAREALDWLARHLEADDTVRADRHKLAGIVAISPEELCLR